MIQIKILALVVGLAIGWYAAELGVPSWLVLGLCALTWLLPESSAPSPEPLSPEAWRKRRKAIIRSLIDQVDPPLPDDEYRIACRKLFRATEEGLEKVTLRFGERTFRVAIEYTSEKIKFTLREEKPSPAP